MPFCRVISTVFFAVAAVFAAILAGVFTFAGVADAQADNQHEPASHTIEIRAWGDTGDERMELAVGDEPVQQWDITTSPTDYVVTFDSPTEKSAIAVRFINDAYRPPYDRNLTVDYIVLDGVRHETEQQNVLSTGSFNPSDGCKDGFKRSQTLSCEGQFIYDVEVGGSTLEGTPSIEGVVEHCGEISTDEKWSPELVHVVTCPVTVASGAHLAIGAGSIVKFEPEETGAGIIVGDGASLDVRGSASNKVIFTSNFDDARGGDTNGERSNSTLRPGRYGTAITVSPGSTTRIQHALVDYASVGIGDLGSTNTEPAALTMIDSQIQNSLYLGANFDEPQTKPAISRTVFARNELGGLRLADRAQITDIPMVGEWANSFQGTAQDRRVYLKGVSVPAGDAWSFGSDGGAVLVLEGDRSLNVDGRFTAQAGSIIKVSTNSDTAGLFTNAGAAMRLAGTADDPVVITSILDDQIGGDTNNDDNATAPRPGSYPSGITMTNGSSVVATNTIIRYGETGISGEGDISGGDQRAALTVIDSVLSNHAYFGIHLNNADFNANVRSSVFANNGLGGVRVANGNSIERFDASGDDINTFTGDAQSRQLWLAGAEVGRKADWSFSAETGATLSLESAKSLQVAGTVTLEAGTVTKVSSNSRKSGFHVVNGGILDINGAASAPVIITSVVDDAAGGDSNGDGAQSEPGTGNYRAAIRVSPGGTVYGDNVEIAYSRIGILDTKTSVKKPAVITMKNAVISNARYYGIQIDRPTTEASFQRTTIKDSGTAILATRGALRFRGAIVDSKRGIRACNFGGACEVDARFVDWGNARGPFKANGNPLVCGEVSIGKWKDQPASEADTNFIEQNCDGSTPAR